VAHGVHEFQEAGMIPIIVEHVWNINPLLDESSTLGEVLKALFGYNGNPSLIEVASYLGYLAFAVVAMPRLIEMQVNRRPATAQTSLQS
ncbi:MAG: hypothetical protein KC496_14885, partial [Anaerolineae bacterium]|nr:hypothetical protein [Anaerolineae bacterium]